MFAGPTKAGHVHVDLFRADGAVDQVEYLVLPVAPRNERFDLASPDVDRLQQRRPTVRSESVILESVRRHLVLLAIAVLLVALPFAVAVVQKVTGARLPSIDWPLLMIAAVALAFSLPLGGAIILFAARPRLRDEWRRGNAERRLPVIGYLAIEAIGASIAWTAFFLVLHR